MLYQLSYTGSNDRGRIRTCAPRLLKYPESAPLRTLALLQRKVDTE